MDTDIRRLVHELEVHQIELEMQNKELMQTRAELEATLHQYRDLYDFAPMGYFTLARDGAIRMAFQQPGTQPYIAAAGNWENDYHTAL